MTSGGGAVSPYEVIYNTQVKPVLDTLDAMKGTLGYYDFYRIEWTKVEQARQEYRGKLPFLRGFAMLKVAEEYYRKIGYEVECTDGTDLDDKYNIDLIAHNKTLVVAQVKSGTVTGSDVKRFCRMAVEYLKAERKDGPAEMHVVGFGFEEEASGVLVEYARELFRSNYILFPLLVDRITEVLPEYKRIFEDMEKIK